MAKKGEAKLAEADGEWVPEKSHENKLSNARERNGDHNKPKHGD